MGYLHVSQNNIRVTNGVAYSTITILKANDKNGGEYVCNAKNKEGELTANTTLLVPPTITNPRKYIVSSGNPLTIPCSADGYPTPTVQLMKDGKSTSVGK